MINKIKEKSNKLIIFLLIFILGMLSIYIGMNAVNLEKVKSEKDLWSLTQNPNDWYGFNPNDMVDKELSMLGKGLIWNVGAYCIDHHTGNILDATITKDRYAVRHFIDVNVGDLTNEQIKVYGNGEPRVYNVKETEAAKNALEKCARL